MPATIILDSSFLLSLEHFESYCRNAEENPLPLDRTPLQGLSQLTDNGVTLLMPNAVLRELSLNQERDSLILGRDESSKQLTLDIATIKQRESNGRSRFIFGFIRKQYEAGKIQLFDSVEAFQRASDQGNLKGMLAIVATHTVFEGTGVQTKQDYLNAGLEHESGWASGDNAIEKIVQQLEPRLPTALASNDRGLIERIASLGKPIPQMSNQRYLALLSHLNFFGDVFDNLVLALRGHELDDPNTFRLHMPNKDARKFAENFAQKAGLGDNSPSLAGWAR